MPLNDPEIETTSVRRYPAPGALDRWGPFERLQRVGRGSFGEVYRAFDPTLQRHVALKLLLPSRLNRDDEATALLREAQSDRAGAAPERRADLRRGPARRAGRVLERLRPGPDARGTCSPRRVRWVRAKPRSIGIDVCRAAGAVHAAGLLHRDIKAGNVMREEGGRILLMDFGLTHEHGADEDSSGTPAYMAPELLRGQPASVASDVYAIGVHALLPADGAVPGRGRGFRAAPRRACVRHAPDPARRPARSARSARPRRRDGDQRGACKAFRQHGADDRRAVRRDRPGHRKRRSTPRREAARVRAPGSSRPSPSPPWRSCWPSPQRGRALRHRPSNERRWPASRRTTGARTTCWRTTTGRRRSKRRFRCSRRSSRRTRNSRPRSRTWGAPTSCSSPSSATRSTSNRRAKPRCARSRWRPTWRRRT